jgi:hypothetical protein
MIPLAMPPVQGPLLTHWGGALVWDYPPQAQSIRLSILLAPVSTRPFRSGLLTAHDSYLKPHTF